MQPPHFLQSSWWANCIHLHLPMLRDADCDDCSDCNWYYCWQYFFCCCCCQSSTLRCVFQLMLMLMWHWCVKIPNHFQVLLAPIRALPNVGKEVVPIQMWHSHQYSYSRRPRNPKTTQNYHISPAQKWWKMQKNQRSWSVSKGSSNWGAGRRQGYFQISEWDQKLTRTHWQLDIDENNFFTP